MKNDYNMRIARGNASGRRHLRNPVHTQRSVVCAGCLEDAISVTPYIHSGA